MQSQFFAAVFTFSANFLQHNACHLVFQKDVNLKVLYQVNREDVVKLSNTHMNKVITSPHLLTLSALCATVSESRAIRHKLESDSTCW